MKDLVKHKIAKEIYADGKALGVSTQVCQGGFS